MDLRELSATCRLLGDSLTLIDDTIVVCRQGLHLDLTEAEREALEAEIEALAGRREEVVACMAGVASSFRWMPVPAGDPARAVAALTDEVERLMEHAESGARAVELASRVLVLAGRVQGTLNAVPAGQRAAE